MIVLQQPSPIGNIIRMILGAESDASMRIHGNVMLDISDMISKDGTPTLISISQVDSEARTIQLLNLTQLPPPFYAPICAITSNGNTNNKEGNKMLDNKDVAFKSTKGTCDYCKAPSVDIIQTKLTKPICGSCFALNMGLAGQPNVPEVAKVKKPRKSKGKTCDESQN